MAARDLPSLAALLSLEAVLRHTSVRKAAQELGVTPAAVSQHLSHLEKAFGVDLFLRTGRILKRSDAATRLLRPLTHAFDELEASLAEVRRPSRTRRVTLSALPSFVDRWILPRLTGLLRKHPEIELTLLSERSLADLDVDVDLVIRYCVAPPPGTWSERLLSETVFPVLHPRWLLGHSAPLVAEDLVQFPWLHDRDADPEQPALSWEAFCERHHLRSRSETHLRLNDSGSLTQAALMGLGVALGRSVIVSRLLESGQLLRPIRDAWLSDRSYYLLASRRRAHQEAVRSVIDWFLKEATEDPQLPTITHGENPAG